MIIVTYNFYDANGKFVTTGVTKGLTVSEVFAEASKECASKRQSQQLEAGNVRVFEVEGAKLGAALKQIDIIAEEGQNHGTNDAFNALFRIREIIKELWA